MPAGDRHPLVGRAHRLRCRGGSTGMSYNRGHRFSHNREEAKALLAGANVRLTGDPRGHEWLLGVGLTRSTHDGRTTGFGATSPSGRVSVKDPSPPKSQLSGRWRGAGQRDTPDYLVENGRAGGRENSKECDPAHMPPELGRISEVAPPPAAVGAVRYGERHVESNVIEQERAAGRA